MATSTALEKVTNAVPELADRWVDQFAANRAETLTHAMRLTTTVLLVAVIGFIVTGVILLINELIKHGAGRILSGFRGINQRSELSNEVLRAIAEEQYLKEIGRTDRNFKDPEELIQTPALVHSPKYFQPIRRQWNWRRMLVMTVGVLLTAVAFLAWMRLIGMDPLKLLNDIPGFRTLLGTS